MKIEQSQVNKIVIKDVKNLDWVHVYYEDIEKGKGRIVIMCYGRAWSAYWGGIGTGTIIDFFLRCNNDYLIGNLDDQLESNILDIEAMTEKLGYEVDANLAMVNPDDLVDHYGQEWHADLLPTTTNPKYDYLSRIIDAVKAGFKKLNEDY